MGKIYSFWLFLVLLASAGFPASAATVEQGQLQANHVGYYVDANNFVWYIYLNDNDLYAKCYLGASTVTAPTWVTSIKTITDTQFKTTDATGNVTYTALPVSYVFEDAPDTARTYTYTKTASGVTEKHDLSYTVENQGAMATVYYVYYAGSATLSDTYNEENPLVLTVPDEVTLTLGSYGSTSTGTKANVKITRLGSTQVGTNQFTHLGDGISYLGVPVKLQLGANVQVIMANALRVNTYTPTFDESYLTGCTNLYGLDFNGNAKLWYIGANAFKGASNLRLYPLSTDDDHAVDVPSTLTQIQDSAFANSGIRSLVVSHVINNLGNDVFMNCDNMEYVTFRDLDFGDDTPAMMLSRDIEKFKKDLIQSGTDTTTTAVPAKYQRLMEGIPTHVLIYAPKQFQKDYTYLDKSVGGYNIITTGDEDADGNNMSHCHHFYVYDNTAITGTNNVKGSYDYWVPHAFYADTCDYNRSFPTGWVTTYLPFNWTLPEGCKAYKASSNLLTTATDGRWLFSFDQVSGTAMTANTPYLIYNGNSGSVTLDQVKTTSPGLLIQKTPHPSVNTILSSDAASKAIFYGTTEDIANDSSATAYKAYNIRSDQVWGKVSSEVSGGYIGRFRSFVSDTRTTSSAKPALIEMTLNDGGATTSISTVDASSIMSGNDPIYTLDGRNMGTDFTRLPDGIYIKKGKKFVVKQH